MSGRRPPDRKSDRDHRITEKHLAGVGCLFLLLAHPVVQERQNRAEGHDPDGIEHLKLPGRHVKERHAPDAIVTGNPTQGKQRQGCHHLLVEHEIDRTLQTQQIGEPKPRTLGLGART